MTAFPQPHFNYCSLINKSLSQNKSRLNVHDTKLENFQIHTNRKLNKNISEGKK